MKKLIFLFAGILILGVFWFYHVYSGALRYHLDPSSAERIILEIENGSSADTIASLLYEKNLISSPTIFKLILTQRGLASRLKAGRFIFQKNSGLNEIIDTLVQGKSEEVPITLLEGWTAAEMGAALEHLGLTTQAEFVDCIKHCSFDFDFLPKGSVEGYLYPDTYFIDVASYDNKAFISRLIRTFKSKLSDEDLKTIKASGRTLNEVVIMASIVEREERNQKEKPVVAGILWKRYDNGIGLAADATVLYGLGRTKGGLTYQDLQLNSPYNTRKYRGLPPTAISNPDSTSLKAAIYPQKSPYLYYLHDSEGGVHYGKTLDEHNLNKTRFIGG